LLKSSTFNENNRVRYLFFLLAVIISSILFGQIQYDTLVLVNGSKKAVILKEIGDKTIKYKLPADSTGPTYIVQTKLVERFVLKNGCIDLKEVGYNDCKKDPTYGVILNDDFKRKIISVDFAQLAFIQHFQFNLEFIPKNRSFGFETYFNKGLFDKSYTSNYDRKEIEVNKVDNGAGYYKYLYFGFNVKVYPVAHKKFTYFMAFGTEQGKAAAHLTIIKYNQIGYTYWGSQALATETKVTLDTYYANYHYNNGFVLRINKNFILQGNLGIGINQFKKYKEDPTEKNQYDFGVKLGLGLMMGVAF
jgi:hypothetical protein